MLPGGLEVVGLFVTTPPDAAKGLYPRLRLLLEQLCSLCSASRHLEGPESAFLDPPHMSRVMLQLCPTTSKYPLRTVCVLACACVWLCLRRGSMQEDKELVENLPPPTQVC